MDQTKSDQLNAAVEENIKYTNQLFAIKQQRELFARKMQTTSSTFGKMMVWFRYKWFDSILLLASIIGSAIVLGFTAKIIWEIWLIIFSL